MVTQALSEDAPVVPSLAALRKAEKAFKRLADVDPPFA